MSPIQDAVSCQQPLPAQDEDEVSEDDESVKEEGAYVRDKSV